MQNNYNKTIMEKKVSQYTLFDLFEDILEEPEKYKEDSTESSSLHIEFKHKLKVFQTIFNLSSSLPNFNLSNNNPEKTKDDIEVEIKEKIDIEIDGNESLFGYTFFLSLNSNFDYSWNYLRKHIKLYKDFLYSTYKFISYVVYDINLMKSMLDIHHDLHIEFNELFDVKFNEEVPVKTTINWANFNKISKVKNGYYISAKYDETILFTIFREYNDKPHSFIENVNMMLKGEKTQTDKKDKK